MSSPQLIVSQQDSLAKLLLTTKNGVPRDVHVVVKNTPFNVVLGIANNIPRGRPGHIDLSKSTVNVDVHYDSDDPKEGKQVKLVTSKPCEYKVHLSDKRFDEASLEVRMKVLTSQHEDMMFRLHLTLTSDDSAHVLKTTSSAIKVVSKPDQVRRINGEKGKKRTHSDVVNESLDRIEKRQQQQQALLLRLLKNNNQGLSSSIEEGLQNLQQKPQQQQPVPSPALKSAEDMSFEAAFSLCMKKYASLPQNERPSKIRKVVSTSSSRDTRAMAEFSEALKHEGGLRLFAEAKKITPSFQTPIVAPVAPVAPAPVAPSPVVTPSSAPFASVPQVIAPVKSEGQSTENNNYDFPLSGSLTFSEDPALTSEFVPDMFQNVALSPFHF